CDFLKMLITTLHNPSAAENFVSAVEHCCLPGGYCSLRFDELDMRAVVRERGDDCSRRRVTITDAYFGLQSFAWIVDGNPIHARRGELIAQQFFLFANHDTVSVRINSRDVERLRISDTNATSLPDRVMMNAGVRADHRAFWVDDFAGPRQAISLSFRGEIAVNESGIITVGNKTDFLRLPLFRNRQIVTASRGA